MFPFPLWIFIYAAISPAQFLYFQSPDRISLSKIDSEEPQPAEFGVQDTETTKLADLGVESFQFFDYLESSGCERVCFFQLCYHFELQFRWIVGTSRHIDSRRALI